MGEYAAGPVVIRPRQARHGLKTGHMGCGMGAGRPDRVASTADERTGVPMCRTGPCRRMPAPFDGSVQFRLAALQHGKRNKTTLSGDIHQIALLS